MDRFYTPYIIKDLAKKMVFIGGPRQVGKTTFSKKIAAEYFQSFEYLNWDSDIDRLAILKQRWRSDRPLIILDELHKYPRWKQWIKGVYDCRPSDQIYLVTGSARLDVYRRGGDSLMGRYHNWRMHPLTIDELPAGMSLSEGYERLLTFGGFPEPFLLADEREAKRWRKERFDRVLKEDIRDLENIRQLEIIKIFVDALRNRVGGLITLSNLAEDLQISPKTAKTWLLLIEKMYLGFAVYPYTKNLPRSLQKPPKFYFYDNADVINDHGARLENLVATTLLKRLQFREDYYGDKCCLYYIRDKEKREVDFVTVVNNEIEDLIEVKSTDADISSALKYYADKLQPKRAIQLVGNLKREYDVGIIQVRHPIEFFKDAIW
jgi:predicted AAA+ superfamily ATPase